MAPIIAMVCFVIMICNLIMQSYHSTTPRSIAFEQEMALIKVNGDHVEKRDAKIFLRDVSENFVRPVA